MKDQTEQESSNDGNKTVAPPPQDQGQSPATVEQAQQETNPEGTDADDAEQSGEGTGARAGEYR